MAYLVAKHIVNAEIIIVAETWMPMGDAKQRMEAIAAFPGQLDRNADGIDGELWIEIETNHRNVEGEPVCFPPANAQAALVRVGMTESEAARILTADYARQRQAGSVPLADLVRLI